MRSRSPLQQSALVTDERAKDAKLEIPDQLINRDLFRVRSRNVNILKDEIMRINVLGV
jgi:hypothetical protein